MKKKIIITLLLLFVIFPIKADAVTERQIKDTKVIRIKYKSISVSGENYPIFCVGEYDCNDYAFMLNRNSYSSLVNRSYSPITSLNIFSVDSKDELNYASSNTTTSQAKLIQKVIEHGNLNYYAGSDVSDAYALAKQILILEILDGRRTSFDANNVEVTTDENSYYGKIKKYYNHSIFNKNVYDAYHSVVKSIANDVIVTNDYTFDNPLYLYRKYDDGSYRYYNEITYSNDNGGNIERPSDNFDYDFEISSNKLRVYAYFYSPIPKPFTIRKTVGTTDSVYEKVYIFKSQSSGDLVLGRKKTVITKTIYAKTASDIQIRNVDQNNNLLVGASYQVLNSNDEPLRFDKVNNNYVVSTFGEKIVLQSDGSMIVYNLPAGKYKLRIQDVPSGYIKNANEISFEINSNNTVSTSYTSSNNNVINVSFSTKTTVVNIDVPKTEGTSTETSTDLMNYKLLDNAGNEMKFIYDNSKGSYKYDPSGTAIIQRTDAAQLFFNNLPEGTYRLVNVSTGEEQFINVSGENLNIISSSNSGELIFYNLNENGNSLQGGKFKIQKYNTSTGNYVEAGITKVNDNEYRLDSSSKTSEFTLKGNSIKFTNTESGAKYRITQLMPPDGYEITSLKESQMDVEIDDQGYPTSTAMIVNKSIIVGTQASDSAELIVAINTGQQIIKYGVIFTIVLVAIVGLLIFKRRNK